MNIEEILSHWVPAVAALGGVGAALTPKVVRILRVLPTVVKLGKATLRELTDVVDTVSDGVEEIADSWNDDDQPVTRGELRSAMETGAIERRP